MSITMFAYTGFLSDFPGLIILTEVTESKE